MCFLVSPFMIIGNIMEVKLGKGLVSKKQEILKDADLLCGDAIVNYRTVQSFGYEEKLV